MSGEVGLRLSKNYNVLEQPEEDVYIVTCREYHLHMEKLEKVASQKSSAEALLAAAWGLVGVAATGITFGLSLRFVPSCPTWLVVLTVGGGVGATVGAGVAFFVVPLLRRSHRERIDEVVDLMQEVVRRHHRPTIGEAGPGG